jgi:hypothetical protein
MVEIILGVYSTAGSEPRKLLASRLIELPAVPRVGEEIEFATGRVIPVHQVFWRPATGTVEVMVTNPADVGDDDLVAAGYELSR